MKKSKLPKTDSIEKLARFWGTHDVTDFEDELQEVNEPVFERTAAGAKQAALEVPLNPREVRAVERMARLKGLSAAELVRAWVMQKIEPRRNGRTATR